MDPRSSTGSTRKGSKMARSRTLLVLVLALGSTLGIFATATAPAVAAKVSSYIKGGGEAGEVREPAFVFKRNNGKLNVAEVERQLFKIPHEYGEPFAVTSTDNGAMVWYRSEKLGVRNVVLLTGQRQPVHVLQVDPITKKKSEDNPGR